MSNKVESEHGATKEGDEVVTTIEAPVVPGTEEVLEAANKFIEFVNGNKPSK